MNARLMQVRVPDIGDFKDVAVIEMLVKEGDTIRAEQSLVTVESDKASMEIPSSQGGVVKAVKVKLGDKLNIGDLILELETAGAAVPVASAAPVPAPVAAAAPSLPSAAAAPRPTAAPSALPPHASPSVRKFARELGVPLEQVRGSGTKGRITERDVQDFVKRLVAGAASAPAAATGSSLPGLLPWPQIDFAKFGAVDRNPLARIKKISGANLHRNWVLIPHVTNHEEADITELESFRVAMNQEHAKAGTKFTLLAFLIRACVSGLQKFPEFNASLDGDELVLKRYFHIGFAADTPNGLVVPVIKDADQKSIAQIAKEMGELAAKAREGKLSPAEMSGGCFSISSLGGIGGTGFTPIINAPEVAILGVCKSVMKPVWNGKEFEPRLMLPLSLSWDHRVIDGAAAGRFNAYLAAVLADFRRVLL
ncbi:dihydrolipoyllysine-residue acetyltransferase [Inhella proteolytica]|uniref:Acetyltransferase component of pyruvate dehydrogenase complex n=1 Tax=Inhella proteolytica TaxID=2795029 RepID=A0A931J4K5_9BURK|nr:dihydrolipoyllysine-residue acetyltransferase [Inhella proteolytica]MBH9578110.1 dihydrolipoyllysine-residue acetyltransferase [Inhella proteolytica]